MTGGASRGDAPRRAVARPGGWLGRARPWILATLLTLVFAALLGRKTSIAEIVARLRDLPPAAFLAALASLALAGVFRALRLQLLLPDRIGFAAAYAFNQIYNVVTATVPTGIGEAASAWLMQRTVRVPLHHGLVALFVGRFLDLVVLLCLFLAVMLGGNVRVDASGAGAVPAAIGLLAVLVALAVVQLAGRTRLTAAIERVAGRPRPDTTASRVLRRGLTLLVESLHMLPHGGRAALLVVLSFVMQLVSLGALYALLLGAHLDLSYAAATVCFVIYVLLRMLPLQGIGGIGTTATWWAIALSMLGTPAAEAATVGAVLYVAFLALLLVLCVLCLPLLALRGRAS